MTPTLTLFYREGCHLCDDMLHALENQVDHMNFILDRIDIDADSALREKYNTDVPVLALDEQIICHHFLDVDSLERALSNL